jgi:hypothetical protein
MSLRVRLNRFDLRQLTRKVAEELRQAAGLKLFAALNISTLAFAAWTLWIYLSYGRSHQQLTIRQLELAVRQSEAASEAEVARAKLALENAQLESQLRRLAIGEATEGRIKLTHDLGVYLIDRNASLYEGDFQLHIQNVSRAQVEISWVVFEWYIGTLPDDVALNSAIQINAPPKRERSIEETGPLRWNLAGRKGFRFKESRLNDAEYFVTRPYFQEGGGPTKILVAGTDANTPYRCCCVQGRLNGSVSRQSSA